MTRARSVAASALFDQAAAAGAEAARLMAAIAAEAGGRLDYRVPSAPLARLLGRLAERAVRGDLTVCDHLGGGPQPSWWVAYRPSRLRCQVCAARAVESVRGTREDARCDSCRRDSRGHIWPGATVLPGVVVDLPPLLAGAGPIICVFGLCRRCHHAVEQAGQAER